MADPTENPSPQSNPPDPQVPANTGLTEEQIQAADNPVNPAVDPTAGQFVYDENGEFIPADSAPAELIQSQSTTVNTDFTSVYNVETGNFDVIDDSTGEVVQSGLTEQAATLAAQNAALGVTGSGTNGTALTAEQEQNADNPVDPAEDPTVPQTDPAEGAGTTQTLAEIEAAQAEQSRLDTLRAAQNIRELRQEATQDAPGDWRVKLRLAPLSKYLYNDPDNNILAPLRATDGVIFPYTPQISTVYHANYNSYDLTHSNHRGYFYQNSYVGEVQIQATFTAQDTREAEYLLAVIHFFRSATKMFYGGGNGKPDEQIGSPPPLVFLSGLGDYQFSEHPCVIAQFNYNLPNDVDYLRVASPSIVDTNLQNRRPQQATTPTSLASLLNMAGLSRLAGVGATPGAAKPITTFNPGNLGLTSGFGSPTYVPSKIDLNLVLLPVQSRKGVSQQFSLRDFAAGNLLKGGFW